jgi:hypothetical protein
MAKHTPGPWAYIASNANHGPYVTNDWGAGDICDCYAMSNPSALAVCNGGDSKPIHFQHDEADANARLIAASPDLLEALKGLFRAGQKQGWDHHYEHEMSAARAAIAKAEGRS